MPTTTERGYGWRWQKARKRYLQQHPLCVMCLNAGQVIAATVVDHRIPHKGNERLMWDETNWQSLCKLHHDSDKQRMDKGGRAKPTIGTDGWPIE